MNSLSKSEPLAARNVPAVPGELIADYVRARPQPQGPRQKFAMLPFEFICDLFELLTSSGRIHFIDFSHLPFTASIDIRTESGLIALYKQEFADWKRSLPSANGQIQMLIQHDSDDGPAETEYICELEAKLAIHSTTAVFARKLSFSGEILEYGIDWEHLKRLQDEHRMCFAYHCNAAEIAGYDETRIATVFDEDIDFLRSHGLDIHYFSPHGGVLSATGKNNNSYFYPALSRHRLIWTHNRYAPSGVRYSDGSWLGRIKKSESGLDIRNFLLSKLSDSSILRSRIIALLHPQYYFARDSSAAEPNFALNPWLEEYWALYSRGRQKEYWAPVKRALEKLA